MNALTEAYPNGMFVGFDPASRELYFRELYFQQSRGKALIYTADGVWAPYEPLHPWLEADGMVHYMQVLRGEQSLPHTPPDCEECERVYKQQLAILDAHGMLANLLSRKKNPGRKKLSNRMQVVRDRLRIVAQLS